jgi:hypothetical protein
MAADSCVLFTAMDAYARLLVVGVAAKSAQAKAQALEQMRRALTADVRPAHAARNGA